MERVAAAAGERAIDVNQVLDTTDFGAEDDLIRAQAIFLRDGGGVQCANNHGFHGHFAGVFWVGQPRVLVHHAGQERLIEGSPVDTDTHRLLIFDRDFDHGAEVGIIFTSHADIAGVDAVLGKGSGTSGVFLEQDVSVIVEVADDRNGEAAAVELFHDVWDGGRGVFIVHRDTNQFRSGTGERRYLLDRGGHVGGVSVRHGLHHNWCIGAHADVTDGACNGFTALD